MNETGYVVRETYIRHALEMATPDEARQLTVILQLVSTIDDLDRSFPDRLQKARASAGIEVAPLSKSAAEAASQSSEADREYHRLLSRKCGRADSASAVIQELFTAASDELEFEDYLNDLEVDEPCRQLAGELLLKKQELVRQLEAFLQ